jgi:hypothetical protein
MRNGRRGQHPKRRCGAYKAVHHAGGKPPKPGRSKRPPERDLLEVVAIESHIRQKFMRYYVNRAASDRPLTEIQNDLAFDYEAFTIDVDSLFFAGNGDHQGYPATIRVDTADLLHDFQSCFKILRKPGVAHDMNHLITERTEYHLAKLVRQRFDELTDGFFNCMKELLVPLAPNGRLDQYDVKDNRARCVLSFDHCKFEISAPTHLTFLRTGIAPVFKISAAKGGNWERCYRPDNIIAALNDITRIITPHKVHKVAIA